MSQARQVTVPVTVAVCHRHDTVSSQSTATDDTPSRHSCRPPCRQTVPRSVLLHNCTGWPKYTGWQKRPVCLFSVLNSCRALSGRNSLTTTGTLRSPGSHCSILVVQVLCPPSSYIFNPYNISITHTRHTSIVFIMHRVHCESKKLGHFYFYCNFGKCWSIFTRATLC